MSTWKRWSWPYRLGILFTLMTLLSGFVTGCPYNTPPGPYAVPGVRGHVYPPRQTSADGRHYYGIREDSETTRPTDRVVYEGSREYELIERFFRNQSNPVGAADRSGVPGGSGTPPPPPVN